MLIFLKFYLAHLIPLLILRNRIAENRARLLRSFSRLGLAVALINFDLTRKIFFTLLVLTVLLLLLEYLKQFIRGEWLGVAIEQFGSLIIIAAASIFLTTTPTENAKSILRSLTQSETLYLYSTMYIAVIFGGAYFVQKITQYFMKQIDPGLVHQKPGMPNAGKYIGWLERGLVLTFIAAGYPDGVGLLLAAKALARYPEIKSDDKGHFAEYFLIGTLTSVSVALVAGFMLIKMKSIIGK